MSLTLPRAAVLDIGSNSVRLLLCERIDADGPVGARTTTVTGLRRGAAEDGTIAPDALHRLDVCLRDYAARIAGFGATRVVAVGTNAARDAPNRGEVARIVRERLGTELRVLSGEEEALRAFAGARLGVGGEARIMVLDIGGGSTELVTGGAAGPEHAVSLPLGAVRQTEAHLHADPPAPEEIASLRADARAQLAPAIAAGPAGGALVGVAGTITTLAAIALGEYDPVRVHRHVLTAAEVGRIARELGAMPLSRRAGVPGLEPARAPVIVAGAAIAEVAMELLGADEMVVSERDLLDGVAVTDLDSVQIRTSQA